MAKNVGGSDRIVRILGGLALLAIGWRLRQRPGGRGRSIGSSALLSTGASLLSSGLLQRCPANARLGVDTREQGLTGLFEAVTGGGARDEDGDGGRTVPAPTNS